MVGYEIVFLSQVDYAFLPEIHIIFARFICGIVLHVSLQAELVQGMKMMKYAVNHRWKFESYKIAFWSGFLQAFMVVLVESVNFMAILTTT